MKITRKSLFTFLVAIAFSAAPAVNAATISWGPAMNITNSSTDVSTVGTLHSAISGATGTTTITVNGVTFNAGRILTGLDGSFTNTNLRDDNLTSRIPASLDNDYEALLQTATRLITNADTLVTITGLTAGTTYAVQVWAADGDVSKVLGRQGVLLDRGTPGESLLLKRPANAPQAGQYRIGTFTADGATQTFTSRSVDNLDTTPILTGQTFLNAVQVRVIPEPRAALLGGLGLLALLRRRRNA